MGFAVWGNPRLRTMSVLLGLAAGTAFYLLHGLLAGADGPPRPGVPVAVIAWPLAMPSFEAAPLPGFLAGALACTLRAFGDIVASQRANDRGWQRPDYDNIEAGVLADGLVTLAAGLIGTVGLNTYSASVGLAVATEVLSRRVAIGVGIGWILLALLPGSSTLVLAIPQSVLARRCSSPPPSSCCRSSRSSASGCWMRGGRSPSASASCWASPSTSCRPSTSSRCRRWRSPSSAPPWCSAC